MYLLGVNCIAPPTPDELYQLEPVWNGNLTDIDGQIDFVCSRGQKFAFDMDHEKQNVTCRDLNAWDEPEWKQCVESEHYHLDRKFTVIRLINVLRITNSKILPLTATSTRVR